MGISLDPSNSRSRQRRPNPPPPPEAGQTEGAGAAPFLGIPGTRTGWDAGLQVVLALEVQGPAGQGYEDLETSLANPSLGQGLTALGADADS